MKKKKIRVRKVQDLVLAIIKDVRHELVSEATSKQKGKGINRKEILEMEKVQSS